MRASGVVVTFTVTVPVPTMSKGPLVVAAANSALIRLAKAYYENDESIIMAVDTDPSISVDIRILSGPLGG